MIDGNVALIMFVGVGLIVLMISERNMRIRLTDSPYLMVAAISAIIFTILIIIMLYSNWKHNENQFLLFQKLAMLPLLTIFIAGYFYYEAFITVNPPLPRVILFLSLYIFVLTFNLFNLFNLFAMGNMHSFTVMLTFFYGSLFHAFAFWVYSRILKLWNRFMIKIDLLSLLLVGLSMTLVAISFGMEFGGIISFLSLEQMGFLLVAMVLMIVGIGILMFNNIKWGDYVYYIPIPIHMILIYNAGGLMVYSRNVHTKSAELIRLSEVLLSGGLSGFSSFFQEILGSNSKLTYINAKSYEFLFQDLPEELGTLVVISSGTNYFLQKSMKRFVNAIGPELLNKIRLCAEIKSMEAELDTIVMKKFPFLILDNNGRNENVSEVNIDPHE
jgi:hypothetical protein